VHHLVHFVDNIMRYGSPVNYSCWSNETLHASLKQHKENSNHRETAASVFYRHHLLTLYEVLQHNTTSSTAVVHVSIRDAWPESVDEKYLRNHDVYLSNESHSCFAIVEYETYRIGSFVLYSDPGDISKKTKLGVIASFLLAKDTNTRHVAIKSPVSTETKTVVPHTPAWIFVSKVLIRSPVVISMSAVSCAVDLFDYNDDQYVIVQSSIKHKFSAEANV
jgi:hypothetical protein